MYSTDKRWKQLGELIVNHSTGVKSGERVMIAMVELESYPLVRTVYDAAIRAGAFPQVQFLSEALRRSTLKHGDMEQLAWVPEIEAYGMEWADVYIALRGAHNLAELWDISADRLSINQATMGKISTLRWQKTRWCLVRVPDADLAQQANLDLDTLMDMFFDACLIDWGTEGNRLRGWAQKLDGGTEVRVVGRDTDLRFSIAGRTWIVADGHTNMPDGEIFTAPVTNTIDGRISFELPAVLGGRLVPDIKLRWEHGTLVDATSSANQDFLQHIVSSDAGASLIGEFGIGTNAAVTHFCKDILIDEKIGGTIHTALGRAYPECGGTNQSAIHWDIVKDIRLDGAVYVDGQEVLQNGVFLL